MDIKISLPVTRGTQSGKTIHTAAIPFKLLVRMFQFCDQIVPAEHRAQRKRSETRVRAIANYILANPETFALPSVTANLDADVEFVPVDAKQGLGLLQVPLEAVMNIIDGQHRHGGIALALDEDPSLAEQTISAVIYLNLSLEEQQQMFSDFNANASRPSGSINALYDKRNLFGTWILEILSHRPDIRDRIDMDANNPAPKSSNLWGLIAFHKFISLLTGVTAKNIARVPDLDAKTKEVLAYLDALNVIPKWQAMLEDTISAPEMREKYVISHAVFLNALGVLGAHTPDLSHLCGLKQIEPSRVSPMWDGRCVVKGKMYPRPDGIKSTAAVLMRLCGIELPEELAQLEAKYTLNLFHAI